MKKRSEASTELKFLSKEEIAARRIPIEEANIKLTQQKWRCSFCDRNFSTETTFLKHYCRKRERAEEARSLLGQAAYSYYVTWLKAKKFNQPSAASFQDSKYYQAFINFAQLVKNANISKPDKYIELMVEAEVQPVLWCREQCYSLYIEWEDRCTNPLDQVQSSISYLIDICERENCQLGSVFNHLGPQRVISLVRQRRLTPWLLFCSPQFGAMLLNLDMEQKKAFNAIVNASYWGERFKKERATIDSIKMITKELGL